MHCNLHRNIKKQFQQLANKLDQLDFILGFITTLLIIIKVSQFVSFRIYIYIYNLCFTIIEELCIKIYVGILCNEVFKLFSGSYYLKMKMNMSGRVLLLWWYIMALQLCFTFGSYLEYISFRFSIFLNLSFFNCHILLDLVSFFSYTTMLLSF